MLRLTDFSGQLQYALELKAAQLAEHQHGGRLPSPIGTIEMIQLDANLDHLPNNPLFELYPNLRVLHFALVVEERFKIWKGDKWGIAFYEDNRGTSPGVFTVRSEFGVSNLSPIGWSSGDDPNLNPKTAPYIEWRLLRNESSGQIINWSNARGHGTNVPDWIDGRPGSADTMYSAEGVVYQSVVTPEHYGLGTAQQQLAENPDALTKCISTLVYFVKPEFIRVAQIVAKPGRYMTEGEWLQSSQGYNNSRSAGRGPVLESLSTTKGFEVTHGDVPVTQPVCPPYLPPYMIQPQPQYLVMKWLISEQEAQAFRPSPSGGTPNRKGFGWTS